MRQTGSSNTVRYEKPNDESKLAASAPPLDSGNITKGYIKINPNYSWDVNNTPDPNNPGHNGSTDTYNLQNVTTHEFGHWLYLDDLATNTGCNDAMMFFSVASGNGTVTADIDLSISDKNGINYKYP